MKSCYLGFTFHGKEEGVVTLHCTHVYLGECDDYTVKGIKNIVDDYFKFYGKPKMPTVHFDVPGIFNGMDVLISTNLKAFNSTAILRGMMVSSGMHKSEFKIFVPHITLIYPALYIRAHFTNYALVSDRQIIHQWEILKDESSN